MYDIVIAHYIYRLTASQALMSIRCWMPSNTIILSHFVMKHHETFFGPPCRLWTFGQRIRCFINVINHFSTHAGKQSLGGSCQAEESKVCGNDAFSKERYEKAPEVEEGKAHDPSWPQRIDTNRNVIDQKCPSSNFKPLPFAKHTPPCVEASHKTIVDWMAYRVAIWGDVAVGEPSQQFHPLQFCLGYCGLCKCLSVSCWKAFYTTHCVLIYVNTVSPTVLKTMQYVYVWILFRYIYHI